MNRSSLFLLASVCTMQFAQAQTWQFTDVTISAGFDYEHEITLPFIQPIDVERFVICSGVASGDYDNDGWVDLYVVRGDAGPNLLFRNKGDGTFEEKGGVAGVDLSGVISAGPLFADFDGDGNLDLFVGAVGGLGVMHPSLFRNLGDGTFEDITPSDGIGLLNNSFGASAGDYDRDGDLDLYIAHWIMGGNGGMGSLFQNDGNANFTDVTVATGLSGSVDADFAANFTDIDSDGWPDILLAADFGNSRVFHNNQNGTFTDTTDLSVITDENGMGAAVGDYDNDGDLDWFVSSIWDPNGISEANWGVSGNRLYRNLGDGTFEDATDAAGVREGYWGWGSSFMDFNNDGHLDIFQVNGFQLPFGSIVQPTEFFTDPSRMFVSNGDATFSELSATLGLDDGDQGRGIACFDYDRDGDIDIFVANNNQSPIMYRNDGGNQLHYLDVNLVGEAANTEAIGAKIHLTVNGVTQMRELRAGSNYASQNPAEAHFGIGSATMVDELRVVWPSGSVSTLTDLSADQEVTVLATPIPASYFGTGCPANQPLTLNCNLPRLGASWLLGASPMDPASSICAFWFGESSTDPGIDLSFIGAPGCFSYTNANLGVFLAPVVNAIGLFGINIPNNSTLLGYALTVQASAASNSTPAGFVTSNGATGVIGS